MDLNRRTVLGVSAIAVACATLVPACEKKSAPDSEAALSTDRKDALVPDCGNKTITGAGVGNLRIGITVDSVKSRCTVARDTTHPGLEGSMERRLLVVFDHDLLDAEIVNGRVWRLDIDSPPFRTLDSLGAGSSLSDLLKLPRVRGLVGEGVIALVSPAHCGISFILSGGLPQGRLAKLDSAEMSRFPASTRVSRVLVYGCSDGTASSTPAK